LQPLGQAPSVAELVDRRISPAPPLTAVELSVALTEAARRCRETVADYRAGMLDDAELHAALEGCGLTQLADGGWVLRVGPGPGDR
jgi:hypothetical protein